MAGQSTFLEELMAAGRGVFGLLVGDKRAGSYFDFSRRGLYGSLVAIVLIIALGAALPLILSSDHDPFGVSAVQLVIIYAAPFLFGVLVLRQNKRMDALVPFLVGYNWANFFGTLILEALQAAGIGGGLPVIVIGIALILVEVNIARFVMNLAPLQIAALLVAQIVGICVASLLLLWMFPPSADAVAQLAGS